MILKTLGNVTTTKLLWIMNFFLKNIEFDS